MNVFIGMFVLAVSLLFVDPPLPEALNGFANNSNGLWPLLSLNEVMG